MGQLDYDLLVVGLKTFKERSSYLKGIKITNEYVYKIISIDEANDLITCRVKCANNRKQNDQGLFEECMNRWYVKMSFLKASKMFA